MKTIKEFKITEDFLNQNSNIIFVFGDNTLRKGKGGAAILRDHYQTYGFITKRRPNNQDSSFYTKRTYLPIFERECNDLISTIERNPHHIFYVTKLGAGLANKNGIWESIIKPQLSEKLKQFDNVFLLWDE